MAKKKKNKQTHEKMLTIPGHKGNANQSHSESISLLLELQRTPPTSRTPPASRTPPTKNVGEDVGKRSPPTLLLGV
jgi:hypothetical protein